jgi:LmbE family N-acetylglucosaminyl deacetylase
MLSLQFVEPPDGRLSVLAVGAHPDDIEIGAGGALLSLACRYPRLKVRYVVLTGTPDRQMEARRAAAAFLPGTDLTVSLHALPEGQFPAIWGQVKDLLDQVARSPAPDLIFAPQRDDAHQDHRIIAEIIPTVFRDQLILGYEIPKWDGDFIQPSMYFALSAEITQHKLDLLHKCFPSQHHRDWWDSEVFRGLARLRGMECRAPYAEAFTCAKSVLATLDSASGGAS